MLRVGEVEPGELVDLSETSLERASPYNLYGLMTLLSKGLACDTYLTAVLIPICESTPRAFHHVSSIVQLSLLRLADAYLHSFYTRIELHPKVSCQNRHTDFLRLTDI